MKLNKPLLAVALLIASTCMAQYPTTFSWNALSAPDQKIQGPCHIFAVTSTVETWYRLLYGSTPSLSQAHLFSRCANADPVTTTEKDALTFLRDVGVVDNSFLPYSNSSACNANAGTSSDCNNLSTPSYFTAQLIPTNRNASVDCSLPYSNCTSGSTLPTTHYRIAGFQELAISGFADANGLKRAIMNNGPIALWMHTPLLHSNINHAYCLYGWNGANWLLTDSWPCGSGQTQNSLDIVSLFKQNLDFKAYILTNSASKPAVYREHTSGTSWVDDGLVPFCPNTSYSNAFSISGATTITPTPTTLSVTSLSLLDNPTVEWSYSSSDGSSVNFTSTTGASVNVTAVTGGTGQVRAKIKRPNGLCETISLNVTVNYSFIPFTYTKIQDQCISGVRVIVYQVTSPYTINCTWDFRPAPGSRFTTSISGCRFTVNYTSFNTSYGLLVSVTSPSFPGQTNGATAGGTVLPCTAFAKTSTQSQQQVIQQFGGSVISIYPNPVHNTININPASNKEYSIQITDALGKVVFTGKTVGSTQINAANFSKGVYVVRLSTAEGKEAATVKKIVVQ